VNYQPFFWLCIILLSLEFFRLFRNKRIRSWILGKPCKKPARSAVMFRPKSEKDCPYCRLAAASNVPLPPDCPHVILPWDQAKGKGGPKKSVATEGYFCSNPACRYFGVTDPDIHAIVGKGKHPGVFGLIQNLQCQACHAGKFSVRRYTPLYCLKSDPDIVCKVLHFLALGVDASAIEEVYGIRESTIRTWLSRSGDHGRKLHDLFFTNLELVHIQLDELWGHVKHAAQEVWVWTICDAKTKLIPVIQLGPRTQDTAYSVVHELKTRLKSGCVPIFSSDGLKHYFYSLTAHFGEWVEVEGQKKLAWMVSAAFNYAQVIKYRHRTRIVDIEQRFIWGSHEMYRSLLKAAGLSGNINTAYVERANLTIRECVSKLARRTWGTAQYSTELREHLEWWRTYYHFARYHESLRIKLAEPVPRKGKQRPLQYRSATPAMAAGLTRRRWSVMELLSYPVL